MSLQKFYIQWVIVAIIFILLIYFLNAFAFFAPLYTFSWLSLFFFAALTGITYLFSAKAAATANHLQFMNTILGIMGLKFLLSLGFIITYFFLQKPGQMYFLIPFFVHYMAFTIIEVIHLVKMNKNV